MSAAVTRITSATAIFFRIWTWVWTLRVSRLSRTSIRYCAVTAFSAVEINSQQMKPTKAVSAKLVTVCSRAWSAAGISSSGKTIITPSNGSTRRSARTTTAARISSQRAVVREAQRFNSASTTLIMRKRNQKTTSPRPMDLAQFSAGRIRPPFERKRKIRMRSAQ